MPDLDYGLFDADNHYYESRDCFTRHLDPHFRDKAIRPETDETGRSRVRVGDKPFTFLEGEGFAGALAPKAGALREMLRALKSGGSSEDPSREPMRPEYLDREKRLARMDSQGLEGALLFPTLAVCVEHFMQDDTDQLYANLQAFNRWLDEDWGFAWKDRIYAPPLLSLRDVDRAVEELDFALARGARVVALRPGPAFGRSPADPHFDPFWARVNEAKLAVAFHIAESGYNEMMSVHWGERPNPASHRQSALQWTCFYGDRPIMDTIAALVFHNLFGRFPHVKILSVENGSLWVAYLMQAMDKMKGMGRAGPWPGGYVKGRPSEILKRHVWVSPYHEEDVAALCQRIGPQQVLFGSDFPHPEGLAEPRDFADTIANLPAADLRDVMRENARRLISPDWSPADA
jgi:predicted TIM-barrel fold metal-dependent hydrolase